MPRLRILLLALLTTLLSGGLAAGLAWRWLIRDVLARRAGRSSGWEAVTGARANGLGDLWAGLRLLPVTWAGVLLALPLWPSAFPEHTPQGLWFGWGAVTVFPAILSLHILGLLAHAYLVAPRQLAGDATTEAGRDAWKLPFRRHLAGAALFALPALVVGGILVVAWPGLLALRLAVLSAAVAPAVGAIVAIPSFVKASGARHLATAARTRRPLPRWATPVGFLTLAFAWGVVGARVHGVAANDSPLVSERTRAELEPALCLAALQTRVFANVVRADRLAEEGLGCETEVVQWTQVGQDAVGWCETWIAGEDGNGYGTIFFLTEGADFGDGKLPTVIDRTFLGAVEAVAPIEGGALVVEHAARRPGARDAVVVTARGSSLRRTARRALPHARSGHEMIVRALGSNVAVGSSGSWAGDEQWVVLDRRLAAQLVSPWSRLDEELGAWLAFLAIAAIATAFAVRRVARAGRLGRVIRRRAVLLGSGKAPGAGLFRGQLADGGALVVLRTDDGESLAIDPAGAQWLGWQDGAARGGPCVVVGERGAQVEGAYRSGLPLVRGGRPFAIVQGDLQAALHHADALREASLRRDLPLLWALSALPFVAVILSS